MPNIGVWEIVILVIVLLLVFGSRRLPEIGRSMGKGMREFKDSVTGKDEKGEREPHEPVELTGRAVEEDEEPVGASAGERDRDSVS